MAEGAGGTFPGAGACGLWESRCLRGFDTTEMRSFPVNGVGVFDGITEGWIIRGNEAGAMDLL